MALHHVLVAGAGPVDLGPVVVVVHEGLKVRVRQDAHLAFARRHEYLLAAPAEGDLVRLDGLLVRGQGRRLRRGQDVELIALVAVAVWSATEGRPRAEEWSQGSVFLTLVPTIRDSPSGCHAKVKASPSPFTSLMQALVRTSQNLTTPSLLTEQSSASLTGLKATFSIAAAWPLSSVEKRTFGFSGFPGKLVSHQIRRTCRVRLSHSQTRSVLSAAPVAIKLPWGFHAIERMLKIMCQYAIGSYDVVMLAGSFWSRGSL